MVMPLFTIGQMRRREPWFRQLARDLLDAAEREPVVDVSTALAIPCPVASRATCSACRSSTTHDSTS
jgi:cytochrome P450